MTLLYDVLIPLFLKALGVDLKPGSRLSGLNLLMLPVIMVASNLWYDNGQRLVITSGTDGDHSANSKHYTGLALDFRTHYFTADVIKTIADKLQAVLGSKYFVLVEPDHIHVNRI